jgi:phospholipid transport system substrate-binding protein
MAIEESAISTTMRNKIDTITEILKHKDLDITVRNRKIIDIIDPIFDFRLMGKLSLGKQTWQSISKEQRAKFISLFDKKIKASYIEKVNLYSDEKVIIKNPKNVKSRIHLLTFIVSKGEQNEVFYKFYKSKNRGWIIYDVDVLGVSIIQAYRKQFAEVLKDESFDQLLQRLK